MKWDYFRELKGADDDWTSCVLGCVHHNYTDKAIKFLIGNNFVPRQSVLSQSKGIKHYVCAVMCNRHQDRNKPAVLKGPQRAKLYHHFCDKYPKQNRNKRNNLLPLAILR